MAVCRDPGRVRIPPPLPPDLSAAGFSAAQARRAGVPKGRLRRADLAHPVRGGYCSQAPTDLRSRVVVWRAAMPEARAFSHVTAARLLGLPLPRSLERLADDGDLHVMAATADGCVQRPHVVGHRGLEIRNIEFADGIPVVGMADTWCDLASVGPRRISIDDLVVLGDHVVRSLDRATEVKIRPGSVTSPGVRALHAALGARVRPRGKVMLREALALIRPRVKSPMESRARLMFVRAEFPEPVVNLPITDEADEFLAEGDLVWEEQRVVAEFQGEHHADRRRRSADSGRGHLLRSHVWTHEELWAEDVFQGPRRRAALLRFAAHLDLDPTTLLIA